jgi:hypothetical protein
MSPTLSRREMLALLGAAVAGGVLPMPLHGFTTRRPLFASEEDLEAWVNEHLAQADVKAIATAWKAKHPSESSAESVARAILSGRRRGEPLADFLPRVVTAEHRDGRAEVVDGWYFAPTEARLAMLLDLVRAG